MFKTKRFAYFMALAFISPCLSPAETVPSSANAGRYSSKANLSLKREKKLIYDSLDYLMTDAMGPKKENKKDSKPQNYSVLQNSLKKWKIVFGDSKHNSYAQDLLKSKKFSLWAQHDLNPLFFAMQFENMDMVKFLSEKEDVFSRFKERYKEPILFHAIMVQNLEIIEFFLNHPEIDLTDKDSSQDNIFHFIFLGPYHKNMKAEVVQLLFQEKYFSKISHLLNEPNGAGSTAFDYFLRDQSRYSESQIIMRHFLEKGALPTQMYPIFLNEEELDQDWKDIKLKVYKSKGIKESNFKEEKGQILSHVQAYQESCRKAVLNSL